jgi:hypothetical protein
MASESLPQISSVFTKVIVDKIKHNSNAKVIAINIW